MQQKSYLCRKCRIPELLLEYFDLGCERMTILESVVLGKYREEGGVGVFIAVRQRFSEEGLKIIYLCLPIVGKVSSPLLNICLHGWSLKHFSVI